MSIIVAAREADGVLQGLFARCRDVERVESVHELRPVLERRRGPGPIYLDLIGHSTTSSRLLQLGRSVIDMCDPRIVRFFEELTRDGLPRQAGIVGVRLLGCGTATTPGGRHTIRRLASTLRIPVYGTKKSISKHHCNECGFDRAFAHLLVEATALPGGQRRPLDA